MAKKRQNNGKRIRRKREYNRRIVMEENIFVVSEPAFDYFCHFKTNSGSSRGIDLSLT